MLDASSSGAFNSSDTLKVMIRSKVLQPTPTNDVLLELHME